MTYVSLSDKLNILSRLVEVAKADGVVNPAEISYIFWTAQKLKLSQLEIQRTLSNPHPSRRPILMNERIELFHQCITMAWIDNRLETEEIEICRKIANDLSLAPSSVEATFEQLNTSSEMVTLDELKKLFGL